MENVRKHRDITLQQLIQEEFIQFQNQTIIQEKIFRKSITHRN